METSLFLAKLLGVYCCVVGLGVLLNPKRILSIAEEYAKSSALIYIGGILALFFGLLIVLSHNVWVSDYRIIITLFGWLGLLKGIWLIIFPSSVEKFLPFYQNKPLAVRVQIILIFIIGLFLSYKGFCGA